jgi:hypothetical protein
MEKENDLYKDPSNAEKILYELTQCPTVKEILDILNKIYPKWIIVVLNQYCGNYPQLQLNWEKVCKESFTDPKKIVIVDFMFFDENHRLIRAFAEIMTRLGFCVRSKNEILPCESLVCGNAVTSNEFFNHLQHRPEKWSSFCKKCQNV